MSFLAPSLLWTLLLALPLIGVFLLKVRPRRHPTTAIFLWDRVFTERESRTLFRRFRDAIGLLILLCVLLLVALSAARPTLTDSPPSDVLVVIDRSLSMARRTDSGDTLFDRARRLAEAELRSLAPGARGAVASIGSDIRVEQRFTWRVRELLDAINTIEQSELPSDARSLERFGRTFAIAENTRVLVLSDGGLRGEELPDFVRVIDVGGEEAAPNASITAADLVATRGTSDLTLFFALANDSNEPASTDVILKREEITTKVIPIELEPNERVTRVLDAAGEPGGFTLSLAARDASELDNVAYLRVPDAESTPVFVAATDPYFFEVAINAVERSEGLFTIAWSGADAGVLIARGRAPDTTQADGVVIFAPDAGAPGVGRIASALVAPLARQRATTHPALRYLPIESLRFDGARGVTLASGCAVLIESDRGVPLVWETRVGDRPALIYNFDPAREDFYLSPYFPVLVRNAVSYVSGIDAPPPATIATGTRVAPPGLTPDSTASITRVRPEREVRDSDPPTVAFGESFRAESSGLYAIESDSGRAALLGVSATHVNESIASAAEQVAAPTSRTRSPLWMMLAIAAVIALTLEEWLHSRRVVG